MTTSPKVQLPKALAAFIQAQANDRLESCGLLIGQVVDGCAEIDEALAAPNVATNPANSFEIDPATRLQTQRAARAAGRQVLGLYHTHPKGTAKASARDHAGAKDEVGLIWVIATSNDLAIYTATPNGLIDSERQPR